jgi:HlyD family secretion protein
VDLFLVTDAKPKAVRVANGPALKAGQSQDVFVLLNDGKAQRRRITTGLSNFDFMEIKEGLKTGETVIVSDLSAFKNVTEIKIK